MVSIKEAILVEGKYDKITLSQVVDAPIFVTNGFGIFKDKAQMALLRQVAQRRGLIVFTDADGAGLVIRNHVKSAIASEYLKHAYTPDIIGKERRKSAPGKEGKLGVEGMTPQVLLSVLERAGATFEDGETAAMEKEPITKMDFFELGLTGGADSTARRAALLKKLNLPERMTTNALLEAVNILCSREELLALLNDEKE